MEWDDLKAAWQKEVNMTTLTTDFNQVRKDFDKLDRQTRYSWLREGAGAIIGIIAIIAYVWFVVKQPETLLQIAAVVMIAPLAYAVWRFYDCRQSDTTDDWTVLSRINQQIEKRRKDVSMLANLAYWHLIPVYSAGVFFSYAVFRQATGNSTPSSNLLLGWAVALAYFVFMHFLNRNALNKHYRPALEKLEDLKRTLEQ